MFPAPPFERRGRRLRRSIELAMLVLAGLLFGGSGFAATPAITSISEHTCAIDSAGTVYCWGDRRSGVLGDGLPLAIPVPANVPRLASGVATMVGGAYHSCAVSTGGEASCW